MMTYSHLLFSNLQILCRRQTNLIYLALTNDIQNSDAISCLYMATPITSSDVCPMHGFKTQPNTHLYRQKKVAIAMSMPRPVDQKDLWQNN